MNRYNYNKQPENIQKYFRLCVHCNHYYDIRDLKNALLHWSHDGRYGSVIKPIFHADSRELADKREWTKYEEPISLN